MLKPDRNCTLCKLSETCNTVCLLGVGPRRCDVMIIGEAPGREEDQKGKPFIGDAGELLDEILEQCKIDREDVYVTNAVSCRPPENRTPSKREIRACKVWLDRQFKEVKPKYVLLLGNTALFALTGFTGIKKRRGKPFERDGITYLPTYHPAYILRDENQRFLLERDIKLFKDIIDGGGIPRENNLDFTIVKNRKQVEEMLDDLEGHVSFDIETSCLYPWGEPIFKKNKKTKTNEIVGFIEPKVNTIGFGTSKHQWILPIKHKESPWSVEAIDRILDDIEERLKDCVVSAQFGKFDFLWMWVHHALDWYKLFDFDTGLAHYALDENDHHGLKYIAQKYCGAPDWDIDDDSKKGNKSLAVLALYQAHDLYYTRQLKSIFGRMLREDPAVRQVFDEILMPCARMFVEVEFDGVYLHLDKMADVEKYLHGELNSAKKAMNKFGELENWGSPDQLAAFLFGKKGTPLNGGKAKALGLKVIEATKTGKPSTSESVILRIDHPIGEALLKFRGAKQQLSFFIDGWKPFIHRNRLHPSFKLHGTVTGRLSCEHPNLQQVPRDERIRSLITAPPGWTLVEADLSQIELRIAAELAQERTMLEAFVNEVDVHWLTVLRELERGGGQAKLIMETAHTHLKKTKASAKKPSYSEAIEVLLEIGPDAAIEINHAWKELRKKAKAINFGYLYGMWWKKFKIYARDNYGVNISDEDAEASRKFFFATYSDYPKWHDKQRRFARRNGYVRSLSGRKRRLPAALSHEDTPERREAERQAINSPVQSFANELNLMSAIQLRKEFSRSIVRMCGTIHDSILVWVKNEHVERVTARLLEIMSHPDLLDVFDIELGVPVIAEAKIGDWGVGVSFEKWRKTHGAASGRSRARPGKRTDDPVLRIRTPAGKSARDQHAVSRSRLRHGTRTAA